MKTIRIRIAENFRERGILHVSIERNNVRIHGSDSLQRVAETSRVATEDIGSRLGSHNIWIASVLLTRHLVSHGKQKFPINIIHAIEKATQLRWNASVLAKTAPRNVICALTPRKIWELRRLLSAIEELILNSAPSDEISQLSGNCPLLVLSFLLYTFCPLYYLRVSSGMSDGTPTPRLRSSQRGGV
jgi:hypothetical protein